MRTEERIKMRMEELKDSLAYSEFYDEHGYDFVGKKAHKL